MSAIAVERLLTWTNRTRIGVAYHVTALIFYNITRCYGKHVAVFAVAVAAGDIILILHSLTGWKSKISSWGMWLSTEAQPRLIIIFRGMIFSTITQSGNEIFILLYRTLDPLFSTVLGLPWWGEFQRENNAHPLIDMYKWKYIFQKKMFLLNSLNARTDHDVQLNKLRHKKSMTSNLIPSSVI